MKKLLSIFGLMMILSIAVTACGSNTTAVEEAPAVEVEPVVMDAEPQSDAPMAEEPAAASFPAWYSAPMTDVNTGRVFTIEENLGKVILVETMAAWCSKCFSQQSEVADLHDLLGERSDFVSIGIDVDPREDVPLLTSYVRKNGFDWLYVVASKEMVDEISALYGAQYLNPPSTPMLIIDRSGNPHLLKFGIKGAGELLESITPFLDENVS